MNAATSSESLLEVQREAMGSLLPFLPDTPWTTPIVHAVQRRSGHVYVDSHHSPRNVVMVLPGAAGPGNFDQAYLLGLPSSDGLRTFVASVDRPTEIVCDDDIAPMVLEFHPDAKPREAAVFWNERLEPVDAGNETAHVRRMRLTEAESLARLVPPWTFRTFASPKEMLMGGAVYGIEQDGHLVSVACTVDQSVKYERFTVVTAAAYRRRGLGRACALKLLQNCVDSGRLPCAYAPRRKEAAMHFALSLTFQQRALLRTYLVKR